MLIYQYTGYSYRIKHANAVMRPAISIISPDQFFKGWLSISLFQHQLLDFLLRQAEKGIEPVIPKSRKLVKHIQRGINGVLCDRQYTGHIGEMDLRFVF